MCMSNSVSQKTREHTVHWVFKNKDLTKFCNTWDHKENLNKPRSEIETTFWSYNKTKNNKVEAKKKY